MVPNCIKIGITIEDHRWFKKPIQKPPETLYSYTQDDRDMDADVVLKAFENGSTLLSVWFPLYAGYATINLPPWVLRNLGKAMIERADSFK